MDQKRKKGKNLIICVRLRIRIQLQASVRINAVRLHRLNFLLCRQVIFSRTLLPYFPWTRISWFSKHHIITDNNNNGMFFLELPHSLWHIPFGGVPARHLDIFYQPNVVFKILGPLETRKSLHYRAKSNCLELAPPGSAPWPSFSLGLRTDFGVGERKWDFTARLCFVLCRMVSNISHSTPSSSIVLVRPNRCPSPRLMAYIPTPISICTSCGVRIRQKVWIWRCRSIILPSTKPPSHTHRTCTTQGRPRWRPQACMMTQRHICSPVQMGTQGQSLHDHLPLTGWVFWMEVKWAVGKTSGTYVCQWIWKCCPMVG